jgi:low affinity Fe/Cu permease
MEVSLYTNINPVSYNLFYTFVIYGVLLVVFIEYNLFEMKIKKMNEKMDYIMNSNEMLVKENDKVRKMVIDIEVLEIELLKEELRKLKQENEKKEEENDYIIRHIDYINDKYRNADSAIDELNDEIRCMKMELNKIDSLLESYEEQQEYCNNSIYTLRKYITLSEHSDASSYIPYPKPNPNQYQVSTEIHKKYNSDVLRHTYLINKEKINLFKDEIELYEFNYKLE